ncbi:hypothetical protein CDAR_412421, partial [Caerostris darwini]
AVYRNQKVRRRVQSCAGGVPHQKSLARCEVSPCASMRSSRMFQKRVDSVANDTVGGYHPASVLHLPGPRTGAASAKQPVNA